jgi:four helix bundle protein
MVWQKSVKFSVQIYRATTHFPDEEKFGLTNQMRRSAVSIPANIAEGAGRNSEKEFKHFLAIANGSVNELETFLVICCELDFLKKDIAEKLTADLLEIQKMIQGLKKALVNIK